MVLLYFPGPRGQLGWHQHSKNGNCYTGRAGLRTTTYDHRYKKIRDPVRSHIEKLVTSGLLVVAVLASYPMATEDSLPTVHSSARPARPSSSGCAYLALRPPLLSKHRLFHRGLVLWSRATLVLSRPSRLGLPADQVLAGWLVRHQPKWRSRPNSCGLTADGKLA